MNVQEKAFLELTEMCKGWVIEKFDYPDNYEDNWECVALHITDGKCHKVINILCNDLGFEFSHSQIIES